jgi:hypothetical protein
MEPLAIGSARIRKYGFQTMKICTKCLLSKPEQMFGKDARVKSRLKARCKKCANADSEECSKTRYHSDPVYRDVIRAKKLRLRMKDKVRQYKNYRDWQKANPGKCAFLVARRRAIKLRATPEWLSDKHHDEMKRFYENANGMHVDHILPLQGKSVCGLHVPWNLQYLPPVENLRKGNKLLDMAVQFQLTVQ